MIPKPIPDFGYQFLNNTLFIFSFSIQSGIATTTDMLKLKKKKVKPNVAGNLSTISRQSLQFLLLDSAVPLKKYEHVCLFGFQTSPLLLIASYCIKKYAQNIHRYLDAKSKSIGSVSFMFHHQVTAFTEDSVNGRSLYDCTSSLTCSVVRVESALLSFLN